MFRNITFFLLLVLLGGSLFPSVAHAEESLGQKPEHDPSRLSVFVQSGIAFLGFDDREKFAEATDSIYKDLIKEARTKEETLAVSRQNFQKVNIAFPVTAGLQLQLWEDHFVSSGIGFIYDNESIVLTDRNEKTHHYDYTLQAVPFFIEYRFAIPNSLFSLSGESLFSLSARWYWLLPGTEIYSSWGKLEAERNILGNGFGISLGYLIGSWKNFRVFGDLGFTSISAESKKSFAEIVPLYDKPDDNGKTEADKKARWDLGGLQLQIRISFGVTKRTILQDKTTAGKNTIQNDLTNSVSTKNQILPPKTLQEQTDSLATPLSELPPPTEK